MLVCALVLLVTPLRETAEPVIKIGFVDMKKLFNEYHRTITVRAEFEAKFNKEQEELDRKRAPLDKLQQELEEKGDTLSAEQRRELEERYREELRALMDYRERKNRDLRREEERAERELLEELHKAVNDYGTSEGYSIIVRKSSLLHGAQSFDLTDDILTDVNS